MKMVRSRLLLAALFGAAFMTCPTRAETSAGEVVNGSSQPATQTFVTGLGQGISWYNSVSDRRLGKSLYCPPPKLGLSTENYLKILRDYLTRNPRYAEMPAGVTLMYALIDTFPCEK